MQQLNMFSDVHQICMQCSLLADLVLELQIVICVCVSVNGCTGQSICCTKLKFYAYVNTCSIYMHIFLFIIAIVDLHMAAIFFQIY